MSFTEVNPMELELAPFKKIGKEWMLVTAGNEEKCNTMTASWGGIGINWNSPVATIYIRPQRYTKEFIDKEGKFSLCFFEESYEEVLSLCGKVSGRETDKIKECNLTTNYYKGIPYFEEASLVLICSTLYQNTISKEGFQDEKMIDTYYPDNDFHEMYIGKIEAVLKK